MSIDGINYAKGVNQALQTNSNQVKNLKSDLQITMPTSKALAKVTVQDAEQALNEPSAGKAVKGLLAKSPVRVGNQQSRNDIESLGYTFTLTAFHIGAPVTYASSDGGTITVYDGKGSAEDGEDQRKTVYENGRYKQEMFYDENGKFLKCEITIKDEYGHTEPNGRLMMSYNEDGKPIFIR